MRLSHLDLTPNGLLGTHTAPIPPFHFHSAWQDPAPAEGSLASCTIPLLANTQTRSSKNRVTWTLKFTLSPPAEAGTTRRFSAVPRGYGPSGAHALEGAVRYAYPFDHQHEATTLLSDSNFLSLPDHVTQYGPVRAQTLGLHIL